MHELSKSIQRRLRDSNFITRYFVGDGIDIGTDTDSLSQYAELFPFMNSVRDWDVQDGDGEFMNGCAEGQYDFAHSSHCLEHIRDPEAALVCHVSPVSEKIRGYHVIQAGSVLTQRDRPTRSRCTPACMASSLNTCATWFWKSIRDATRDVI